MILAWDTPLIVKGLFAAQRIEPPLRVLFSKAHERGRREELPLWSRCMVGPCPPGQDEKMRSLVLRERKRYVMCLGQFNALAVCSAKLQSPLLRPILLSMPLKARRVRSLPRRFRLPSEIPPRTRFSCTLLKVVHRRSEERRVGKECRS